MVKTLIYWMGICCRCTLELPLWGYSNVYQQHMLLKLELSENLTISPLQRFYIWKRPSSKDIEQENLEILSQNKFWHQIRAIALVQTRSCQYECIYKIWWYSINLFSRYWVETKFWHKSRAITLIQMSPK